MNAEEGELRPQLLDRFGLMVEVAAPSDYELRTEVIRRRLDFEADPTGFAARWESDDRVLGAKIVEARRRLRDVTVAHGLLTAIARLCVESQVNGLRADIALYKASRARWPRSMAGAECGPTTSGRPPSSSFPIGDDVNRSRVRASTGTRSNVPWAPTPTVPTTRRGPVLPTSSAHDGSENEGGSPGQDGPRPSDPDDLDSSDDGDGDGADRVIAPGDPIPVPRLEAPTQTQTLERDRPAPPGDAGGSCLLGPGSVRSGHCR